MKILQAITSKRRLKFTLPESVEELTWGQVVRLTQLDGDDPRVGMHAVAVLTNTEVDFWRQFDTENLRAYLLLERDALALTNSVYKAFVDPEQERRAPEIKIDGKVVQMPKDIGKISIGQYQDCIATHHQFVSQQDEWDKDGDGNPLPPITGTLDLYGNIFRIYAQPLVDGTEYDYEKALSLDIDDAEWLPIIAWAYFFLSSATRLSAGTKTNQRRWRILKTKPMRALAKWAGNLGSRLRFTR